MATGFEILDLVVYGRTVFHRDRDAWDLIDARGLVAAVLCPRKSHLSISIPTTRVPPAPVGRRMPYGERVVHKITEAEVERGLAIVADLARPESGP